MNKQVKAYYDLAYDYHVSAVTLWLQIMNSPYLFNPVSYLLRHTIELQLKGLIITELMKNNKSLKIKDIKLPNSNRPLSSAHSLLALWEYYDQLLSPNHFAINDSSKILINSSIKKLNDRDFSSTKYRYPFDKDDKANNIEPVDIDLSDKSPDLSLGIPYIIQNAENVGTVTKGAKLLQETSTLFDVTELLFQLFENS